ncbi:MAG: Fe-S cluster assembly protein SufD [Chitinophagales bacterium]
MNTIEYYKERFDRLQSASPGNKLVSIRQDAFNAFSKVGIPTSKNEEWKYTRISSLFNKDYKELMPSVASAFGEEALKSIRLPGHEEANELVFINGYFNYPLSKILSEELITLSLEEAAASDEFKDIVAQNLGHSRHYLKDGIHALNTAFIQGGVFVHVRKGYATEHPVYIYNITDAGSGNVFCQPRSLIHIAENGHLQLVETYATLGASDSFTNQVMEVVIEKDAVVEYYKIQNDAGNASLVSTTHFRQTGKSYLHTVTISLDGAIVRNNLEVVLDAERCEAHLYGLYFQGGKTHIDNHTVVDNVKPNCFSNELYKGVMNDEATGVFNGKIYVRQDAQKTNAYQSNKNILLSDSATINSKPQLEIFADDVKCSHGCTVGQLDEEALFYLQSRGIGEDTARSLLVHAFAEDIIEHIKLKPIHNYVEHLISNRLKNGTT